MGEKAGRLCFLYQLDFDEHILSFESKAENEEIQGTISSLEEFYSAVQKILDLHKTERIEVALKKIRLGNIYGVCIKSFPRTPFSSYLLGLINLCVGGESGMEMAHLPFQGTILEQPNLLVEVYNIWCDELSKWKAEKLSEMRSETNR